MNTVFQQLNSVARTGYFVSVASYVFFLAVEWLRPGFVSNFISVHVFLFASVAFAVWYGASLPAARHSSHIGRVGSYFAAIFLGLVLAWFAWKEGRAFGDFRILITLVCFSTPLIVARLFQNNARVAMHVRKQ